MNHKILLEFINKIILAKKIIKQRNFPIFKLWNLKNVLYLFFFTELFFN